MRHCAASQSHRHPRGQAAIEQGKQGGLARTLRPTRPNFFAGVEGDGSFVEQHLGASAEGDVFEVDHEKAMTGRVPG
jgi:hypothetical protein